MKPVDRKEVDHIALLSRLRFTDAEKDEMAQHLTNVLGHFKTLDKVETEGVAPMAHLLNKVNVLRKDEAFVITAREVLLQNAPDADEECYIVPKVLD